MSEIPKIIHYCWFGGKPLPKSAREYIKSWEKFFPGYEIKRWDESNFDVNIVPYTAAAYADRKYAFVSDYARFWIIYNYGGIYFDTDVGVVKNFEDILSRGPYMGTEKSLGPVGRDNGVNPGLGFASYKGSVILKELLDSYADRQFGEMFEGRLLNIVDYTTDVLKRYGWQDKDEFQVCGEFNIYPSDYFCPIKIDENVPVIRATADTCSIHYNAGSWLPKSVIWKNRIGDLIGRRAMGVLVKIKKIVTLKW